MKRGIMIDGLKGCHMSVSPAGLISSKDTNKNYGVMGVKSYRMVDGREIPYEEIASFNFMPDTNTLSLLYESGSGEDVYGVDLDDNDKEEIELQRMPSTIAELNSIFSELYPDCANQLYYDELAEREMINMGMLGRPDDGVKAVTDKIMSLFYEDIEKKLTEAGYFGKPPALVVRDHVFNAQTYEHTRNPFREWVESHEWDGKPRVRTWFQRLFGATAPPLQATGQEDRYLGDVAEAWFIGAIKRMYSETKHEIVPVFISQDQGIGKGEALKYTAGRDSWYIETTANVDDPKVFLESVRGNIIIEMSESKQIRSNDVETLKAFISKSSDQMRQPYGRFTERRPRHFILAATSNLENVFVDITGNRRFFPMYCDGTKATFDPYAEEDSGKYEVEQLWAEALQLYKEGHLWYMTEESAEIAQIMQDYGTQENSNVDTIDDWLDDPAHYDDKGVPYTSVGAKIDKKAIMRKVYGWVEGTAVPKEIETSFRAWANGTRNWRKMTSQSVRVDGRVVRSAYERVCCPGERRNIIRLPIARKKNIIRSGSDPVAIMRTRAQKYGFRDTGDAFNVEGLDAQMISQLMAEGYIFDAGKPSCPDFRLAYLP